MAWAAGSIVGKLMLDIDGEGGFASSMLEAEGIARIFPEIVTDFLADPILGFADALKETGEVAIDSFKEIQQDAENVGLSAIKLGVSPEFFSEWAAVAKTVNVGQDQLSQGLRYLEMHAQEALEGSKTAAKGFADVGISMDDLAQHQNDAAWLFDNVREGMDKLPEGQQRINAGQELMSKGGQSLLPVLSMTQQHIDELKKSFIGFGDEVDSTEAASAQKFNDLSSVVGWAMDGIEKAVEKPVLTFLGDHATEIKGIVTEATDWTIGKVDELWGFIDGPKGQAALNWVETEGKAAWAGITDEVKEVTGGIEKAWGKMQQPETRAELQGIKEDFGKMWDVGKLWTGELIDHLPEIVADLRELNDFIVSALPKIGDAAVYVIHALEGLHDMSAQDWQHVTIGGDHFGVNWGPEVPKQTMHSGPLHKDDGERKREEDLIRSQFGVSVPPDWSDDEVKRMADQAAAKSAGVRKPFPGSGQLNPGNEQQEIMAKITNGTATPEDRQRFFQLAPQTAAQSSSAGGGVTINGMTVNVTPQLSDAELGRQMRKKIAQAQAQANAQASMGGG